MKYNTNEAFIHDEFQIHWSIIVGFSAHENVYRYNSQSQIKSHYVKILSKFNLNFFDWLAEKLTLKKGYKKRIFTDFI